jgi:uncharacterized membrane protein (DUF106 family)
MFDIINSLFSGIFNFLFFPFKNLNPVWGMLVISLVASVVILLILKATSDQAGIKRAKNLMKGHFLAFRLYRDDIGLMLDTFKNMLLSNLLYLRKSFKPILFFIVPVVTIIIQLGVRYEYRPFRVGEPIVVTLQTDDLAEKVALSRVELELPEGLTSEIPPVRIEQLREINWRLHAEKPGVYDLVFKYNGSVISKRIEVEQPLVAVSQTLEQPSYSTLINPAEKSLPAANFASAVSVLYPKRDFSVIGINLHWLVAFFVFSFVMAFGLKGVFDVEF